MTRKPQASAHGQTGEIPSEDKPKSRKPVSKMQANATTSRAASVKSAALNVPVGEKSAKSAAQKARRVYSDQEFIEAIYRHNGLIVRIAEALDCDRQTIYNRAATSPEIGRAHV